MDHHGRDEVEPELPRSAGPDRHAPQRALPPDGLHLALLPPRQPNLRPVRKNGWFIAKTNRPSFHPVGPALYDPTNPEARKQYWDQRQHGSFQKGVDAWWLDTDEPETEGREDNILVHQQARPRLPARATPTSIRSSTPGACPKASARRSGPKRVFILSRSAYAGAQRYGVTAWSGDVLTDWLTFQRQIPAGLNYAISGMPYWTTDIGGFISGGNLNDPKFRELFMRWFQFGAFSPIFRVHGTRNPRRKRTLVLRP